ncbi:MAG: hypothetical protein ACREHD_15210 [Pirellulales bacterium]
MSHRFQFGLTLLVLNLLFLPADAYVTVVNAEQDGPPIEAQAIDEIQKLGGAVCSRLAAADKMEFAVKAGKDDSGFSVLVERIPYTPGAHTLYQLSSDFDVVNVVAGK